MSPPIAAALTTAVMGVVEFYQLVTGHESFITKEWIDGVLIVVGPIVAFFSVRRFSRSR